MVGEAETFLVRGGKYKYSLYSYEYKFYSYELGFYSYAQRLYLYFLCRGCELMGGVTWILGDGGGIFVGGGFSF